MINEYVYKPICMCQWDPRKLQSKTFWSAKFSRWLRVGWSHYLTLSPRTQQWLPAQSLTLFRTTPLSTWWGFPPANAKPIKYCERKQALSIPWTSYLYGYHLAAQTCRVGHLLGGRFHLVPHFHLASTSTPAEVRGAPSKKNPRICGNCPNFHLTPLLRTFGHSVAHIFRWKQKNCENSDFDSGNMYFDSDCGQTWFWDGILMEIMVSIDEIWWKLGAPVMVYIQLKNCHKQFEQGLRPPFGQCPNIHGFS